MWRSVIKMVRVWWIQSPTTLIIAAVVLLSVIASFAAGYFGGRLATRRRGSKGEGQGQGVTETQ